MRVGVVAPPWFAVPPPAYGGTERVVSLLVEGLVDRGVDVTLYATGDSATRARLVSTFERAPSHLIGQTSAELAHVLTALADADEFDLLHDHSGTLAIALAGATRVPVVHTTHGPLLGEAGALYARACRHNPAVRLISLTESQRRPCPGLPWVATCPNALDLAGYTVDEGDDGYLLFLGRMGDEKGAHRAIEVAREAGLPLLIAGKCREPAELAYFTERIEPHLGPQVAFLGEVGEREKVRLLRGARALLFPIAWEEPFGLVMIEALACGTPVVATRRGSVPEVLTDGVTGIVVDHHREMPEALARAAELDPAVLRREVERRFTTARLVESHLDAYTRVLAESAGSVRRLTARSG